MSNNCLAQEAEGRSGRLIDQGCRTGFRKDRREAIFLFAQITSLLTQSGHCANPSRVHVSLGTM